MATVTLTDLVTYLDGYLEAGVGKDYCPNGLQVEGRPDVRKLAAGVSACEELFVRARKQGADGVIVHHGLFWQGQSGALTGVQYRRVAELIRGEISLLAYHLPLDRHPVVGNNAVAARAFGLGDIEPFGDYEGQPIGFCGTFAEAVSTADFLERCQKIYGQEPLAFTHGPDPVSTVAIVSGAAAALLYEAIDRNVDLFLTGEPRRVGDERGARDRNPLRRRGPLRHRAPSESKPSASTSKTDFGIEVEFIDIPNPV